MAKGNFTGGSASAKVITGNVYKGTLVIQHTNATQVALGLGEAAVAGSGIQLIKIGDTVVLRGAEARMDIYAIGNGGTCTFQDGDDISVYPGSAAS
jgi:hypothetical protein